MKNKKMEDMPPVCLDCARPQTLGGVSYSETNCLQKRDKRFILVMEPKLHEQAQALAKKKDQSFSGLVRSLLRIALKGKLKWK